MRPILVAFALLLPLLSGCSGEGQRGTIPRATFIETYVALRTAALRSPTGEIDPLTRDRILEERGLTPDDLLRFVEVHGRDPAYMGALWEEVEAAVRGAEGEPSPSS